MPTTKPYSVSLLSISQRKKVSRCVKDTGESFQIRGFCLLPSFLDCPLGLSLSLSLPLPRSTESKKPAQN